MEVEFYNIQTGKSEFMPFEEMMKGVPIGWIPMDAIRRAQSSLRKNMPYIKPKTIIIDGEDIYLNHES